jgi:hypothetical protein
MCALSSQLLLFAFSQPCSLASAYAPAQDRRSYLESPAASEVGVYSFDQILVRQPLSGDAVNEAVQPLGRVTVHITFVEPESELINVAAEVLFADMVADGEILLALVAAVEAALTLRDPLAKAADRAADAVRPEPAFKIDPGGLLVRKHCEKLEGRNGAAGHRQPLSFSSKYSDSWRGS